MKPQFLILVFAVMLAMSGYAQQSYVKYTYDASGNRTTREIIIPLQARYTNPNNTDSVGAATDSSSLQASNMKNGSVNEQQLQPVKEMLSGGRSITIFPNPTQGILKIELTGTLPENTPTATLHDIQGKQVINFELQNGTGSANLSGVPAGVYFLRITLDGKMEEWKIVKQ